MLGVCYGMFIMKPKVERNNEIIAKIDEENWSIRQVGAYFNLKSSTVHEIYHREKTRKPLKTKA